jgi:site-specific DNA-methyltransferase (adenine-specific)
LRFRIEIRSKNCILQSINQLVKNDKINNLIMVSQVTNEDNMAMMARYPDNFFDLAIVDPPYGIKEDGRKNHTRSKLAKSSDYRERSQYDNAIPDDKYFNELFRVSKNQIIWGGNYFIDHLKNTPCMIVWNKLNGDNDFADFELAWTSFDTAARFLNFRWAGMLQGNMKSKETRIHPNQKPLAVYRWIMEKYCNAGDKVLDTHLGSGSSRLAAHDLGIDFYGCELDADYFEDQEKRFKKHISQQQLFTPVDNQPAVQLAIAV